LIWPGDVDVVGK